MAKRKKGERFVLYYDGRAYGPSELHQIPEIDWVVGEGENFLRLKISLLYKFEALASWFVWYWSLPSIKPRGSNVLVTKDYMVLIDDPMLSSILKNEHLKKMLIKKIDAMPL